MKYKKDSQEKKKHYYIPNTNNKPIIERRGKKINTNKKLAEKTNEHKDKEES